MKRGWVRVIFLNPVQDNLRSEHCGSVPVIIEAQSFKIFDDLGLVKAMQGAVAGGIVYIEKGELFKFVDKTFFAPFCALGNALQLTGINAEKRQEFVGFTEIRFLEHNGLRLDERFHDTIGRKPSSRDGWGDEGFRAG